MDILERYEALRDTHAHMRLFALVDGLAYERVHEVQLKPGRGRIALFEDTPDAPLAAAGPWLLEADEPSLVRESLLATQDVEPYVSWLLAELPTDGLAQLLQLKLDARLPDGSTALLRFYDPRVLKSLALTLSASQREEFFAHVYEWHFVCDGQAMRIGRSDA